MSAGAAEASRLALIAPGALGSNDPPAIAYKHPVTAARAPKAQGRGPTGGHLKRNTFRYALFSGLAAAALAAAPALAQDEHPILKDVRKIQEEVAKMRGLEYQAPVKADVQKPETLKAMIMKSFEEEDSGEEMAKQEKVAKAFGLIPAEYELRAAIIKFLSEQIGGFYDPEKKELFLIDRSGEPGAGGQEQELNDKMVMAHELHHALQDQNFALDRWFDVLGDHEDRVQAYKGLIEGEAQLVGMTYLFGKMGRGSVDMKQLNRMQEMMLKMSPEGAKFRAVPPYLIENMMFPYTQGAEFVQELQRKRGWEGINGYFQNPPSSTEQILHPEKYYVDRDEPVEISLPGGLKKILGEGAEDLAENTLGEFSISLLLRALGVPKPLANKAASGWDGDRYVGYQTKDGRAVVIWLSTWDSEDEAARFESTYAKVLKQERPDSYLERRGTEVLWIHGSKGDELKKLTKRAFMSLKMEGAYQPLPGMLAKPPRSDFDQVEGSEPEAAPSAAPVQKGGGLIRVDSIGLSFALPEGFEAAAEPMDDLREMTAAFFHKGKTHAIRVMAMPFDVEKAGAAATREMSGRGWTVEALETPRGAGLQAVDPNNGDRTVIHMIPGGDNQTLALVVSGRKGDLDELRGLLFGLTPWADYPEGKTEGQVHKILYEGHQVSVPQVLEGAVPGDPAKGVIHGQFSKRSRAIVTVRPARGSDLASFGKRLEMQLEGQSAQVLAAGVVSRGDQAGYEIEFTAKGRHFRQLTVLVGDQLWSVSCSAEAKDFEGLRSQFGTFIAGFSVKAAKKREVY